MFQDNGCFTVSQKNWKNAKVDAAEKKRQLRKGRSSWIQPGRSQEWWKKLIGHDAPDSESEWHSNFRLSKEEFQELF